MLDIKRVDTNTSEIEALMSYDDIVATLGMRVGLEGGMPSSAPGTTVTVEWRMNLDGSLGAALVHVVVDHNYVAPAAGSPAPASDATAISPPADSAATAPAPDAPSAIVTPLAPALAMPPVALPVGLVPSAPPVQA